MNEKSKIEDCIDGHSGLHQVYKMACLGLYEVNRKYSVITLCFTTTVLWRCWLGGRKGIRPVKTWVVGCWCGYVWSKVQTCIWPSWCHCHSLSLASVKSRLVLPFWYRLTRVVLEKGPLNGCVCVNGVCVLQQQQLFYVSRPGCVTCFRMFLKFIFRTLISKTCHRRSGKINCVSYRSEFCQQVLVFGTLFNFFIRGGKKTTAKNWSVAMGVSWKRVQYGGRLSWLMSAFERTLK